MAEKRRYFKELRIQQLQAIVEVARGHGFAGAAAALGLTTPSVWHQVRSLEAEFGVGLVDVRGMSVTLTDHGRLLVELATPLVNGFDGIRESFGQWAKSLPRRLVVAAPNSVLINELPEPIRRYRERHPEVELSLIDAGSVLARKLVEDGEVDLAVAGRLDSDLPSSLACDSVVDYPFTLVCPADHPVLELTRIRPRDLVRYPLVIQSLGTNSRARVDDVFRKSRLRDRLRIVFEANTKELLLQYVKLGFGICVVSISPRSFARVPLREPATGLVFRDLSKVFGHEHIVILRRSQRYEPPHHLAFRETILACASGTKDGNA